MTLLSPIQAAIAELAAATAVQAIVGVDATGVRRIRPVEPGPGDSLGAGHFIPFVVVSVLDARRIPYTPVRANTIGLRCYGATYAQAEALYLAAEAVFADRGARAAVSGLGIWHSSIAGGMPDKDPDTFQPLFHGIVNYPTTIASI